MVCYGGMLRGRQHGIRPRIMPSTGPAMKKFVLILCFLFPIVWGGSLTLDVYYNESWAANQTHVKRLKKTKRCPRCNLSRANLRGLNLARANLRGANLVGARMDGINLRSANLNGANLNGARLKRANLRGARMRGAKLIRANLQRAVLRGADLRGANLTRAYLHKANLRGAKLAGATFRGARGYKPRDSRRSRRR